MICQSVSYASLLNNDLDVMYKAKNVVFQCVENADSKILIVYVINVKEKRSSIDSKEFNKS